MISSYPASTNLRVEANPLTTTLPPSVLDRVNRIWEQENEVRGGRLFNGRLFSVESTSPELITGSFVEYRMYVAQRHDPSVLGNFVVRPLGVTGIIFTPDGIVFGKRSAHVTDESECWELVPSGGIDDKHLLSDHSIDYVDQLRSEVAEELGIDGEKLSHVQLECILLDSEKPLVEICMSAHVSLSKSAIMQEFSKQEREHSLIEVVKRDDVRRFLKVEANSVIPESRELLTMLRLA